MNRAAYKSAAQRIHVICFAAFALMAVALVGGTFFTADYVSSYISLKRVVLFGLATPLAGIGILFALWATRLLDRRLGLRCAHCGNSLTFRGIADRVLESGHCPSCRTTVIRDC